MRLDPAPLQTPRGCGAPCSGRAAAGGADKEQRLQPCCAARTRREQPRRRRLQMLLQHQSKGASQQVQTHPPGSGSPSQAELGSQPARDQVSGSQHIQKPALFTRIFKGCYCLGRTHAQARNHRNGEAAQTMEGEAEV